MIPPGYKSSPDKKTAEKENNSPNKRPFSNPTNTTEDAEKENRLKSYIDSDRNLHKKKKFNRDNYVTSLSVPADSDSDSVEETPAANLALNERFSFMGINVIEEQGACLSDNPVSFPMTYRKELEVVVEDDFMKKPTPLNSVTLL